LFVKYLVCKSGTPPRLGGSQTQAQAHQQVHGIATTAAE